MPRQVRPVESSHETATAKYRNWDEYESQQADFDPFKELLQRDPRVCDNCFTLRYEDVRFDWKCGELGWLSYRRFVPRRPSERHMSVYADRVTGGVRLACGDCGRRGSKARPLSKDRLFEVVANISTTLDEKGIAHDGDVLRSVASERNCSATQGRQDSDVLSPAVAAAIRETRV